MPQLEFKIESWLAPNDGDDLAKATLASLSIQAGATTEVLTQVDDTIARTTRDHINVAVAPIAVWLLANWWRLRWETDNRASSHTWKQSHSMAAIGGGFAWPALDFVSDGEYMQLRLSHDSIRDVCAIRYMRDALIEIPVLDFESAVDSFVCQVDERIASIAPLNRLIADLRAELEEERANPSLSGQCKWQALAGIDPGDAPATWLESVASFAREAGTFAMEEVIAVAQPERELSDARDAMEAIMRSPLTIDLEWAKRHEVAVLETELPWERGSRLAHCVRAEMSLGDLPISDKWLSDRLNVSLPLTSSGKQLYTGGFVNGRGLAETSVSVGSSRRVSQRFALARLIGYVQSHAAEHLLLPVTTGKTALQKVQRAFAQEFFCPFSALDSFTEENGLDDDGISDAAEYFGVSPLLVVATLVNNKKLPRHRLQAVLG
jgi:hypothetical protein